MSAFVIVVYRCFIKLQCYHVCVEFYWYILCWLFLLKSYACLLKVLDWICITWLCIIQSNVFQYSVIGVRFVLQGNQTEASPLLFDHFQSYGYIFVEIWFLGGLRVTNPPIRLMCPTSVCPSVRLSGCGFQTLTWKPFDQSISNLTYR